MAELADAADLKSAGPKGLWGFESPSRHQQHFSPERTRARALSADKTIRKVTDPEEQQAESDRYWQSLSVGERLSAVWEISAAAYAFADAFKGTPHNDARRSQRTITRIQRSRG